MIHDAESAKLRSAIAEAHKADERVGNDANALKAERALVEHWLDKERATYIIVAVDAYERNFGHGERVQ